MCETDRHKGEETTRGITLEHSACLMARACYFSAQLRSPARGKTARYCLKKGRVSVLTSLSSHREDSSEKPMTHRQ